MRSVLTRPRTPTGEHDTPRRWLLPAGLGLFAVALGLYVIYTVIHPKSFTMDPVDLAVYRSGGLIVRHVRPLYDPRLAAPLYDWIGYGKLHLPFTYTPFAAIAFAVISFVPWWLSQQLSVAVDILALLVALWLTLGGLGYRRGQDQAGRHPARRGRRLLDRTRPAHHVPGPGQPGPDGADHLGPVPAGYRRRAAGGRGSAPGSRPGSSWSR